MRPILFLKRFFYFFGTPGAFHFETFFPNRSLLLRVLIGVIEGTGNTKREAAGIAVRKKIARAAPHGKIPTEPLHSKFKRPNFII